MSPASPKLRLDKLLVDRGLAASRERAQALILAGRVLVEEQKIEKPGTPVAPEAAVRLLGEDLRYVSRGGLKLEGALRTWGIEVAGRACVDIGASTGGFTDCLLQHGAISVLAVDTGYGQIAHKLRTDPRVTLLERTNARTLAPGTLAAITIEKNCHPERRRGPQRAFFARWGASEGPAFRGAPSSRPALSGAKVGSPAEAHGTRSARTHLSDDETVAKVGHPPFVANQEHPAITFFAMDVSFIGASLVLPAVVAALAPAGEPWHGEAVILVKPQFEAGREHVGKGGIVRDPEAHQFAVHRVAETVRSLGGDVLAVMDSPILGMEGNREFLLHARFGFGAPAAKDG